MKWEYKVEIDIYQEKLNELGEYGWELVAVVCNKYRMDFFFKRPLPLGE